MGNPYFCNNYDKSLGHCNCESVPEHAGECVKSPRSPSTATPEAIEQLALTNISQAKQISELTKLANNNANACEGLAQEIDRKEDQIKELKAALNVAVGSKAKRNAIQIELSNADVYIKTIESRLKIAETALVKVREGFRDADHPDEIYFRIAQNALTEIQKGK